MQKSIEVNEIQEIKDENTQLGIGGDNEVEHGECLLTRFEHQVNLPQEQGEMGSSLEADCDEVSPVGPCEAERVSDVNGYTRSLGGMETLGFLVVTRFPSVIVPECVPKCVPEGEYVVSKMACVSACMKMDDGPIQTGDTNGEPGRPQRVNLATALGLRDGSYEFHGAFRAWPAR